MPMMKRLRIWRAILAVTAFSLGASLTYSQSANELAWRKATKTADGHFEGTELPKVLSRLSSLTGWKIYLQPGVDRQVSVQFKNASQGDALKMIMGELSYALVPQGNGGGSKLYVYETSISEATSFVRPDAGARPKNWIANEVILSLAPGSKLDAEKLAAQLGGKVVAKSEELNAYRIEFPDAATADAAREKIAARADAAYHDNYSFDRPTVGGAGQPSPESLFPIDPKPVTRGDQITVALVDTPIQPLEGKMKDFVLPSIHIRDQMTSFPEGPTHGTSMTQTLLNSMASTQGGNDSALGKVRVLPIDIYGSSPSTSTFEVAQGLHKAIESGAQVINLSLGGTGASPMVDYLLEMAYKKEILVFASAGNNPTTDATYPAANPNTIAVTAVDWNGQLAPYANRGDFVDVKAPGQSRIFFNGQNWISTGTSTATAFISGQAAALAANGYSARDSANAILTHFDINSAPQQR